MIETIQIKDLGVISDAELTFGKGLTVLTGETGAGKTMVLTALGLLLGERSDSSAVRAGANQTSVTGEFQLSDTHPAIAKAIDAGAIVDEGTLLLSRSVSAEGKSKAVAGGRQVPVGLLNEIGAELVVVHGQSDQIRLKSQAAQREALDRFAGETMASLLESYSTAYRNWKETQARLTDAQTGAEKIQKERQDLTEALEFLDKLDPKPNEDVELQELAQRLTHSESLRIAVTNAHDALITENYDGIDALGQIGAARKALDSALSYDSSLNEQVENLRLISQQVNDLAASLSGYLANIEGDSGLSLDEIQERRSLISSAIRRYGSSLEEVIAFQNSARERLAFIDSGSESIEILETKLAADFTIVQDLAKQLTSLRLEAAKQLAERVTGELKSLAMADANLLVEVQTAEALTATGADVVAFMLQPYAQAEPRPIAKAASGGELSRLMLALEVILSESENANTFIFDEVDAGVGGSAAIEVGKRLAKLAKHAQVIVVTHLAQVAAFADKHLAVVKNNNGGFTSSDVLELTGDSRITELARMMAGLKESDSAREHALELLELARN